MKIDHHEFRLAMGMFKLTPDEINSFAKWVIEKGHNLNSFLNEDMQLKRDHYDQFCAKNVISEEEVSSENLDER